MKLIKGGAADKAGITLSPNLDTLMLPRYRCCCPDSIVNSENKEEIIAIIERNTICKQCGKKTIKVVSYENEQLRCSECDWENKKI